MKKILICVLAIVMAFSTVAFAQESTCIGFENIKETDTVDSRYISIEENAFTIDGNVGNGNVLSKFAVVDDQFGSNGKVLKITNPSDAGSIHPYINPTFGADENIKNVNVGFSVYPVGKSEDNDPIDLTISVKYKAEGKTSTQTLTFCKINSGKLITNAGREYPETFADDWFDLRFAIDGKNKVITTYVDGKYFDECFFVDDVADISYMNIIAKVVGGDNEQVAYFDNFFVNQTPVSFGERNIKKIDYTSNCYADDNFNYDDSTFTNNDTTDGPVFPINSKTLNTGKIEIEEDAVFGKCVKFTVVKNTTALGSSPNIATKSVYDLNGKAAYKNEEYIYEIDLKFNNFNGTTELGKFTYDSDKTEKRTTALPVVIASGGDLNVVDANSNTTTITRLERNKWYNFKLHIKPYIPEGTEKLNNGLVADVYFMDKLIAENVLFAIHKDSKTDPKEYRFVKAIRHITFFAGLSEETKERIIYADNLKYYEIKKINKNLLNVVDMGIYNADGKLISSNYEAGKNTFKAYVTAASKLSGVGVSVIAARYDSDNFSRLADVDIVSANVTKTDELTEITAEIDVEEVNENERIKVMLVGSVDALNPYIEPVVLMPNISKAQ